MDKFKLPYLIKNYREIIVGLAISLGIVAICTPIFQDVGLINRCSDPDIVHRFDTSDELTATHTAVVSSLSNIGPKPEQGLMRLGRGMVRTIALSPDKDYLIVGSNVGLYLYNTKTFEEVWSRTTDQEVEETVFSPDGKTLAVQMLNSEVQRFATETGTWLQPRVTLWDVATGEQLRIFSGMSPTLTWSPDGKLLALGSSNDSVTVWDAQTGKQVYTLKGATHNLAWSPVGTKLATGAVEDTAIVWDVKTGKKLQILPAPNVGKLNVYGSRINEFFWSPDGVMLAADVDRFYEPLVNFSLWNDVYWVDVLTVWDAESGVKLKTLKKQKMIGWSSDSKMLASESENSIQVWESVTGKRRCSLTNLPDKSFHAKWSPENQLTVINHIGWIKDIAWLSDGTMVAVGLSDGAQSVIMWNPETNEPPRILGENFDWRWVMDMAWSPDGLKLATAMDDDTISVWDMTAGEQLFTLDTGKIVAWSPDGTIIASGIDSVIKGAEIVAWDERTILWDAETGKHLHTLNGAGASIAWSPDGLIIASGAKDGKIIVWDANNGEQVQILEGHTEGVDNLTWSPDGALLASTSFDGRIIIWETEMGKQLRTFPSEALMLAWSPDGSILAAGDRGKKSPVVLWDVQTGEIRHTMRGAPDDAGVTGLAWSYDGHIVASTFYYNNKVYLWDPETGEQLRTLEGHMDSVTSLAWSPDGTKLASGSTDSTIIVWDVGH